MQNSITKRNETSISIEENGISEDTFNTVHTVETQFLYNYEQFRKLQRMY